MKFVLTSNFRYFFFPLSGYERCLEYDLKKADFLFYRISEKFFQIKFAIMILI